MLGCGEAVGRSEALSRVNDGSAPAGGVGKPAQRDRHLAGAEQDQTRRRSHDVDEQSSVTPAGLGPPTFGSQTGRIGIKTDAAERPYGWSAVVHHELRARAGALHRGDLCGALPAPSRPFKRSGDVGLHPDADAPAPRQSDVPRLVVGDAEAQ